MKWNDMRKGSKVFLPPKRKVSELVRILKSCPVGWHPMTERKFTCTRGRCICCSHPYFDPEELDALPQTVWENTIPHPEYAKIRVPLPLGNVAYDGSCCHVESDGERFGCAIHGVRPVRCRVYPFFPVFDPEKERVVVLNETMTQVHNATGRCEGLGCGKEAGDGVLDLCRDYLRRIALYVPYSPVLFVGEPDSFIGARG